MKKKLRLLVIGEVLEPHRRHSDLLLTTIYIVFLTANNDFFIIINLNLCHWAALVGIWWLPTRCLAYYVLGRVLRF